MSHTEEDLSKQAEAELFVKIAGEQGIDLNKFSEEQIAELYNQVFDKEASAPTTTETPAADAELLKAAEAEFAGNQEKVAEAEWADTLGRRMAHSMVDELQKMAAAEEKSKDDKGDMTPADKGKDDKGEEDKTAGATEETKAASGGSAIDKLALEAAVKIASDGGFNDDEARTRVGAVATLGGPQPENGTKVASAATVEQAVNIRALEYLEAAGYPVTWE